MARMRIRMWAEIGVGLALITAVFAWRSSHNDQVNSYARDVYGMNRATSRRYCAAALILAGLLLLSLFVPQIPGVPLLAAATLLAVLYFTSFARGYSDEM